MRRSLFVILPVFNEEPFLPATLESLSRLRPTQAETRFIAVDDGSSDGSLALLRQWAGSAERRRSVIVLEGHRGVGAALHAGFRAALSASREGDWVTVLEADGSCDAAQLAPLLRKLEEGCDVAIASRRLEGGKSLGFPLNRRLISLAANRLLRLSSSNGGITDYTIFFRAYRTEILRKAGRSLGFEGTRLKGFAYNAGLLLELVAGGARVTEVPYEYKYRRHTGDRQHSLLRNGLELLSVLMKTRIARHAPIR